MSSIVTKENLTYYHNKMKTLLSGKSDTSHTHNLNTMINTLGVGDSTPMDNDYYISQSAGGGSTDTNYFRRPVSLLWNYMKGKGDSVYAAKSHTHNYAGSSSAGGSANSVANSLSIQLNGGAATTFNGSAGKSINITASSIGAAASSHSHNIQDLNNYSACVWDATVSRPANAVLIGPNGSNGVATFRKLVAADLPSHTHNYAGSASAGGAANTAIKLATARTINGTSFDGSSNITTANWGTARNIYISDSDGTNTGSSVSVNGSGNATLKLPSTIKASLSGNASSASKLNSYLMESEFYVTNDTHILKLGYLKCTSVYDNLVLLISSSFWGNQHGSADIVSIYQDTNTNATPEVQCNIKRVRLNSSRVFYYVKDDTNLRLYLYVYVTGGNSYGRWRTSVIQSEGGSWVSEYAINQTLSNKTEITDQLSPVDHTHTVMTNSEIDALF